MGKERVLSVSIKDCEVQTFRAGGPGGQNQNKRDTGVRVVHRPSGAVGESREQRSQLQNKKSAFVKMADHPKFKIWLNHVLFAVEDPLERVKRDLEPKNLLIEYREDGEWISE